jgi:xyloglucan-specific exo-beta-1,4-glucanase
MGWRLNQFIDDVHSDEKKNGWGIEGLSIDPFNSNHFVYGTGLTLFGSNNLLDWVGRPILTLRCSSY